MFSADKQLLTLWNVRGEVWVKIKRAAAFCKDFWWGCGTCSLHSSVPAPGWYWKSVSNLPLRNNAYHHTAGYYISSAVLIDWWEGLFYEKILGSKNKAKILMYKPYYYEYTRIFNFFFLISVELNRNIHYLNYLQNRCRHLILNVFFLTILFPLRRFSCEVLHWRKLWGLYLIPENVVSSSCFHTSYF